MTEKQEFNFLRDEQSAYLKQHAKNPVQWHTYGPEALLKAKEENKPIFLSIGYSSCHWCHVMNDESFEDETVAKVLNDKFINIKIDREELPDIDSYFQLACQVMNGRGGWPLNAFLTPEFKPYFIGTYFPKTAMEGIPSFMELITNMHEAFNEEKEAISENSEQIIEALKSPPVVENKVEFEGHYPGAASVLHALKNYEDAEFGGYGVEPKFPHYSFFEWAIEHILEGMVPEDLGKHVLFSIERILFSGLYDHLRGGVHRYAVNKDWSVPHFEKMLYDQAGLLKMLAKTSLIYPSPVVLDSIVQTLEYLKTEMLSEKGYFFSAQDSDSEGVEGLYFTFTKDEFTQAINENAPELKSQIEKFYKWFNISDAGNFEQGLNVISLNPEMKDDFFQPEGWSEVRQVKSALLKMRQERFPPLTDNKGVASWNFQTLCALIDVVQYTRIESIRGAALELIQSCHQGIVDQFLYQDENSKTRINTSTSRGEHVPLFEDYVMFAEYSFRCYELTGDKNFMLNGEHTMEYIFKNFYKDKNLYTRSVEFNDTELYENIHTPIFDQSYKSSMATFIILLKKWSLHITDFKEYLTQMESSIETLKHLSLQNPLAFGETLRALVYPDEAYRKIEVPLSWYKDNKIQQFFMNFSVRFALVAHENDNEKWQICSHKECELTGDGIEEFKNVFLPPEAQESPDNG